MLPFVPSLVWAVLFRGAVRRREIGSALVRAHRTAATGRRLRELAVRLIAPIPEEDARDFPVLAVRDEAEEVESPKAAQAAKDEADAGDVKLLLLAGEGEGKDGQAAAEGAPRRRKKRKETLLEARNERKHMAIARAMGEKAAWRRLASRDDPTADAAAAGGDAAPEVATGLQMALRVNVPRPDENAVKERDKNELRDDELLFGALLGGNAVVKIASEIPSGEETAEERAAARAAAAAARAASKARAVSGKRRGLSDTGGGGSGGDHGAMTPVRSGRRAVERATSAESGGTAESGTPHSPGALLLQNVFGGAHAPVIGGAPSAGAHSGRAASGRGALATLSSGSGARGDASAESGEGSSRKDKDMPLFGALAPLKAAKLAATLSIAAAANRLPRLEVTRQDAKLEKRMEALSRFASFQEHEHEEEGDGAGGGDGGWKAANDAIAEIRASYINNAIVSAICVVRSCPRANCRSLCAASMRA